MPKYIVLVEDGATLVPKYATCVPEVVLTQALTEKF